MAIGLAHTFGFKLPMNFNMPYLALNISDFWRRWHISLSSWLRDYIYIPLGGNRHGAARTYINLILTMLLGGLWHGANWTFVFWGFYHGALLGVQRAVRLPRWASSALFKPFAVAGTFLLVSIGWVFFRAPTFANAALMIRGMFTPVTGLALDRTTQAIALACLSAILAGHLIGQFVPLGRLERRLPAPVLGTLLAALLIAIQVLVPENGKAFLYFQF
jgi:alginate O-acetyltransferase complex protein AlgI